ncbi:MAG TPA: ABC transporter substrate-binding protein [Euzebyales bacterium]
MRARPPRWYPFTADRAGAVPRLAVLAVTLLLLAGCGGAAESDGEAADAGGEDTEAAAGETSEAADDGAAADGEPIRIGTLTALSGPFAPWGVNVTNGMQMAVAEINEAGGVDGRPLELVERDTASDPQEGVTAFRGMIDQDGVIAAGGVISSDVGLATARIAEQSEVPLFLVKAGSGAILTSDSRYTFRTCLPAAPMTMGPVADYLEQEGLTRAGAIIADYEWGRAIESAFDATLGEAGIETQVEVAPVTDTDFTSYLRSLQGFEPDVIVATGHPPGSGAITSQSAELGLDTLVTGPWTVLSSVMEGVGDAAFDRFVDFDCADYSDSEYQELAARYNEQFDAFMEDDAVAAYGIVTMLAEAVGEVGDDPAAIAEYLHGAEFDLPGYPSTLSWTEWGELANSTPVVSVIREEEPPEGVNPDANWYPEVLLVADPLEPYQPE